MPPCLGAPSAVGSQPEAHGISPWLGALSAEGAPSHGNLLLAGAGRAQDCDVFIPIN